MDFKERLLDELEQLSVKISKLETYIIKQEDNIDISLEQTQLGAMMKYRKILEQRILKLMK